MSNKKIRCGLEVHAQLNFLKTKLFCSCKNSTSEEPNKNTCPICRGLPGSLPSINADAVKFGLKLAKALSMNPVSFLKFSRKHYDYPDLPKGFQITQNFDGILGTDGILTIKGIEIPIRQIQLEEDPAKLSYQNDITSVDYNRSGLTLIELVTDPIFSNQNKIKSFLSQYRRLLYYLRISDTKKEGSFRADVNVSVGDHPRVEIKNVGSDAEILESFLYEVKRQSLISDYKNIGMETRNWDSLKMITEISRDKESLSDYKYIPEGNIPPIEIPKEYYDSIEIEITPWELEKVLSNQYDLKEEQIQFILDNLDIYDVFKECMNLNHISKSVRERFFWLEFLSWYKLKDSKLNYDQIKRLFDLKINDLTILLEKLDQDKLSNQEFRKIFKKYVIEGDPIHLSSELDNTDEYTFSVLNHLKTLYPQHFSTSPIPENKINYLVGLGVKYSKGKVNPKTLRKIIQS
jgi:aspartyl-tRNA(Asn)/glutamyl-tRNA(Gln) amidotransferase subunit B